MAGGSEIGSGVGGLVGGIAALALQGKSGTSQYKEAVAVIKKLKESEFDYRALSAPELRILGQYSPQLYSAIVPAEAQKVLGSPQARESQVKSLGTMEQVRDQGDTLLDRLGTEKANQQVLGSANAANEGVLRNLASRGQLGGGDELQARLAANQGIENNAADLSSNLAEQRALRKISGAQGAASLAGNIQEADVGQQKMNADYITRLNEITSQQRTEAAKSNAAAQTAAQASNTENRQRIGDSNALLQYGTAKSNLERQNALKGQSFDERARKAGMLSGALQALGGAYDTQNANQTKALVGVGQGAGGAAGGIFGF
jgi:hypothetical protein